MLTTLLFNLLLFGGDATSFVTPPKYTTTNTVTLSNIELPRDQNGEKLITGEASAMYHDGYWWFYFNNW